jgi:cytochrome P450
MTFDVDTVHEFFTSWYGILLAVYIGYNVIDYIRVQLVMKKLQCVSPPVELDGFFGFKLLFISLRHKKEGTLVDYIKERFETVEKDTFKFRIAGTSVVSTRNPENIKALLATQFNDFALGTRHAQFKPLLGDGIFTLDGSGWKHSRAMLRPQFAREQVAHVKSLEPHIQVLAKHVRRAQGAAFDVQSLFFRLTVDSATEFLFGESVESLQDESIGMSKDAVDFDGKTGFAEAFNTAQVYLSIRSLLQKGYFLANNKEFRTANEKVHKFADYYVQKALTSSPEELEKHSQDGYIFLYELVKQTRDPHVLRDQLLNILLAGRDTTAGLLSFTFYELARNPRVWLKLKEEIYEKFGDGDNARLEDITFESLKKCEYLKALLNEVLRMYPSVPQNFRVAQKDTSLPRGGGPNRDQPIFIHKGQTVTYTVYAMHRDEKFYGKDAAEFRPERWFEPETRKLGWAFLPFNGGPRICLGQQFALTEASYVIARLAQLFPTLASHDDEYPPRKASHLTMCHQSEVRISLA